MPSYDLYSLVQCWQVAIEHIWKSDREDNAIGSILPRVFCWSTWLDRVSREGHTVSSIRAMDSDRLGRVTNTECKILNIYDSFLHFGRDFIATCKFRIEKFVQPINKTMYRVPAASQT